MKKCRLCPRECGVDRAAGERGRCGMTDKLVVARAALHMWEEPCLSGEEGSGTVFFSGCALGCVYCQNREIARAHTGKEITAQRLTDIFLELQAQNANNINLVTPSHYVLQIREALLLAKEKGLSSSGHSMTSSLFFGFSIRSCSRIRSRNVLFHGTESGRVSSKLCPPAASFTIFSRNACALMI